MSLLQFLRENSISYDPENLFEDVQTTIYNLHISGQIHQEIASDLGKGWYSHVQLTRFAIDCYVLMHQKLASFLRRLKDAGKQLFIVTNSPYWFV